MPSAEKQVRVFISSTFRDMHAERDHLVTVVFPELRERVEQLGLEFFDVDLRWGVPAKTLDGETANSWEYCRQWIDRVEPFFVCILGQRYGWVPEPRHFRDDADRQRQQQEPRSITDLEVRHAVLDTRRKRRSYFYLRATLVPEPNAEYVDPHESQDLLEQLKIAVRQCGRPVRDYSPEWAGQAFVGLKEFGDLVLEDLWSGVLRDERYVSKEVWCRALNSAPDTDPRYTDESQPVPPEIWEKILALAKPPPQDPLDAERQQMEAFTATRLHWFQGRTNELRQLTDFIGSTAENAPRLAVVAALPGQGKSALLAKLGQRIKETGDRSQKPAFLITHFVGATERSATAHALVQRLLDELDRSGIEWPTDKVKEGEEQKQDFNSLCLWLGRRLGDYAGNRRIVILLDALNQLSDGHDLQWLPTRLGPSLRVIVSCVEDAAAKTLGPEQRVLHALTSRQPAPLRVPLGPLTEGDVRTIVIEYLKEYCKELDREHLDAICRMEQARNPLYLLVMLGELRTLGGNDMNRIVGERIAALPRDYPDTVSLFRWVLQRLEVFGTEVVQWWCMYLAHGRVGMASQELADLLVRKLGANAAPTALLIERGLRRYLLRRSGQCDFFHSQLRQAVGLQYGTEAARVMSHSDIAAYFHGQAYFLESLEQQQVRARQLPPTPRPVNVRKVVELPWQRLAIATLTGEWNHLEALFTGLHFFEAEAECGRGFDLVQDLAQAIAVTPPDRPKRLTMQVLAEALHRDLPFIQRHPTTLFQCMWNNCWWHDCTQRAQYSRFAFSSRCRSTWTVYRWLLCERKKIYYPLAAGGVVDRLLTVPTWLGRFGLGGWSARGANMCEGSNAARLNRLLQVWRKQKRSIGGHWFLSLRPPPSAPGTGQQLVLQGHGGPVIALRSISMASGETLLSASANGTTQFWDLASAREQMPPMKAGDDLSGVAWLGTDRLAIASWAGTTITLWDQGYHRPSVELRGHEGSISCIDFSPDGRYLATGSADGTIRIWDVARHREVNCLRGHEVTAFGGTRTFRKGTSFLYATGQHALKRGCIISAVAFSPDGSLLASAANDHTIRLWDFIAGDELQTLRGHESTVNSVAWFPGGKRLVSGGSDRAVRIWDCGSGTCLAAFQAHNDAVWSVAASPDGRCFASAGGNEDQTVCIWDAVNAKEIARYRREESFPLALCFIARGRPRLAAGYEDGVIVVWTTDGQKPVAAALADRRPSCETLLLALTEDAKRVLAFSGRSTGDNAEWDDTAVLMVWDASTGACQTIVPLLREGWRHFWLEQLAGLLNAKRTLVSDRWCSAVDPVLDYAKEKRGGGIVTDEFETEIRDPKSNLAIGWLPVSFAICEFSPGGQVLAGAQRNQVYIYRLETASRPAPWARDRLIEAGGSEVRRFRGAYMDRVCFEVECRRKDGPMPYGESGQRPDQTWLPEFHEVEFDLQGGETLQQSRCPHCDAQITIAYTPPDSWSIQRVVNLAFGIIVVTAGTLSFAWWREGSLPAWLRGAIGVATLLIGLGVSLRALLCAVTSFRVVSATHIHALLETKHSRPEHTGLAAPRDADVASALHKFRFAMLPPRTVGSLLGAIILLTAGSFSVALWLTGAVSLRMCAVIGLPALVFGSVVFVRAVARAGRYPDIGSTTELLAEPVRTESRSACRRLLAWSGAKLHFVLSELRFRRLLRRLKNRNQDLGRAAIDALGRLKDERAVPPLIAILQTAGWFSGKGVVGALQCIGGDKAVEGLIEALTSKFGAVREGAALALGALGDQRAVEPLRQALQDHSWEVLSTAAKSLEKLGWQPTTDESGAAYHLAMWRWSECRALGAKAVRPLIVALGPSRYEVTREAKRLLIEIGEPAVLPLVQYLRSESSCKSDAIEVIGTIGDGRAVDVLAELYRKGETCFDREPVVEALARIGGQAAVGFLIEALEDKSDDVRTIAARGLCNAITSHKVRLPAIKEAICEGLNREENVGEVGVGLAKALGEFGGKDHVPVLCKALERLLSHGLPNRSWLSRDERAFGDEIVRALGKLRDRRAVGILENALKSDRGIGHMEIARALEEIQDAALGGGLGDDLSA